MGVRHATPKYWLRDPWDVGKMSQRGRATKKLPGLGVAEQIFKKNNIFFINFFGSHNRRYFMILRFIPTFLGVKNLMVTFISPTNFIFILLLVLRLIFWRNFFRCQIKRFWKILKFIPKLWMVKKTMVIFILVKVQ